MRGESGEEVLITFSGQLFSEPAAVTFYGHAVDEVWHCGGLLAEREMVADIEEYLSDTP